MGWRSSTKGVACDDGAVGNCGNQADRKESWLKRQTWARVRNYPVRAPLTVAENSNDGGTSDTSCSSEIFQMTFIGKRGEGEEDCE